MMLVLFPYFHSAVFPYPIRQEACQFIKHTIMYLLHLCLITGYINEAGNLNMRRFETFLKAVAEVGDDVSVH